MANSYLTRTNSATGSTTLATISMWIKLSSISTDQALWEMYADNSNYFRIRYGSDSTIRLQSDISNSTILDKRTTRKFKDVNGFYHIVVQINLADSTAEDKIKLYINGERETLFSTNTNTSATSGNWVGGGNSFNTTIGRHPSDAAYLQGYISHYCFVDGTVVAPTVFGETESTSGIWKFKSPTGVTFGTNGFHLKFENSGSLGNDSAGSNNLTVNGNLRQSIDTPTIVYPTWNTGYRSGASFTNGNLTYTSPSNNPVFGSLTSMGVTKGKWYAECKYTAGSNHYLILGVADDNFATLYDLGSANASDLGKNGTTGSIAYVVNTGAYRINNNNTSWGSAGGDGDILMMAMDHDNDKLYFGVNGVWGASSNPETGSNGIDVSSVLTGDTWFFGVTNDTSGTETVADFNFGAGLFGATAITSAGLNGNGSLFEYNVPSGYYALNTKNLNTYG